MRCASCCGDTKNRARTILLLKVEADRISQETLMSLDDFVEKIEGLEPYAYRMKKTQGGKCVFLKEKSCFIYPIRPLICRFYPFQLKSVRNNRYAFTHTEECPGIGKGPQLKGRFFERLFAKLTELMNKSSEAA